MGPLRRLGATFGLLEATQSPCTASCLPFYLSQLWCRVATYTLLWQPFKYSSTLWKWEPKATQSLAINLRGRSHVCLSQQNRSFCKLILSSLQILQLSVEGNDSVYRKTYLLWPFPRLCSTGRHRNEALSVYQMFSALCKHHPILQHTAKQVCVLPEIPPPVKKHHQENEGKSALSSWLTYAVTLQQFLAKGSSTITSPRVFLGNRNKNSQGPSLQLGRAVNVFYPSEQLGYYVTIAGWIAWKLRYLAAEPEFGALFFPHLLCISEDRRLGKAAES